MGGLGDGMWRGWGGTGGSLQGAAVGTGGGRGAPPCNNLPLPASTSLQPLLPGMPFLNISHHSTA